MTTANAGARLGIKPGSVNKLIERGLLKASKIGRDNHITEAALASYERRRRRPGRPGKS